MSTDMTSEQMQSKITAARREAEGLKDRIKRKKDDLADTSCTLLMLSYLVVLVKCELKTILTYLL